jgi:hypothetical protein
MLAAAGESPVFISGMAALAQIARWSAAHAAYNDGGIMRQFPEVIRPLAMTLAGATVPQIVDEIAPPCEYPPRVPHEKTKGENYDR